MDSGRRSRNGDLGEEARLPGPGARLELLPAAAALIGVVLFLGAGLGLAAIGGWTGIAAVLGLAALAVALVAAASRLSG